MSSNLYQGKSKGVSVLIDDYFEYAEEVNVRRALPDVRDGLKPVHRRILTVMNDRKMDTLVKSLSLQGSVSEVHPHSDDAIYDTLVLMTDQNGSWNVPLIKGQGSFGKPYRPGAAAPRYTEVCKNAWTDDLLEDIKYTDYIPKEVGVGQEPRVLPARYPFILTNGSTGIGVGLSSYIPPFNFWEVLDLTQYYLENGTFDDLCIAPDFPTGGTLLDDEAEFQKLMQTGKGSYEVRAVYDIYDTMIRVTEVPFGSTIDKMVTAINNLANSKGAINQNLIFKATPSDGLENGVSVAYLDILLGKDVDVYAVERFLLKNNILQNKFTPYMLWVTEGDNIFEGGVYDIIREWVKFRRKIVERRLTSEIEGVKEEQERLSYFVRLVSNIEHRDAYLDTLVNTSVSAGKQYLFDLFEGIPTDVVDWILQRRASAFNRTNSYVERYNTLSEELERLEYNIQNIDEVIINDLNDLRDEHQGFHERKTDFSNVKIQLPEKSKNGVPKSEMTNDPCFYTWEPSEGLITKHRNKGFKGSEDAIVFEGYERDTLLLGMCADGTIAKLWGSHLTMDETVSIQTHCEVEFPVVNVIDAHKTPKQAFFFKDGGVSFWEPATEITTRRYRTHKNTTPILVDVVDVLPADEVESYTWYWQDALDQPCAATIRMDLLTPTKQSFTRAYPFGRNFGLEGQEATFTGVNAESYMRQPSVLTTTNMSDLDMEALEPVPDFS